MPRSPLLLAVSVGVQVVRDRGWAPFVPPNPTLWLQSGPLRAGWRWAFDNLVADVYWMRAVVYYGGKRRASAQAPAAPANFAQLYPLLDLVTSLDPHFRVAYRFGAIFLTEAYPSGPGRPDLAIALLQRGIEHDSGRWEYMEDIGFVYYWWLQDYRRRPSGSSAPANSRARRRGWRRWRRPRWRRAAIANRRGSLWTQLLQTTDVEWLRRNARHRLQQLDAMDTIDELNRRVERFIARERPAASRLAGVGIAEGLRGMPARPDRRPRIVLDAATGRIDLSRAISAVAVAVGRRRRGADNRDRRTVARRRGVVRPLHRQLSERRHLSPAAAASRWRRRRPAAASAAIRCGGSTTSPSSAGCCCAAVAASAASACRGNTRSSS